MVALSLLWAASRAAAKAGSKVVVVVVVVSVVGREAVASDVGRAVYAAGNQASVVVTDDKRTSKADDSLMIKDRFGVK
jgi:hypothetical protein